LLHLQSFLIADANRRGTIVNKRRRELPKINEQYNEIDLRFIRRCEALDLDRTAPMDLARRLQALQQQARQQEGA
jgi:hypothetical protein